MRTPITIVNPISKSQYNKDYRQQVLHSTLVIVKYLWNVNRVCIKVDDLPMQLLRDSGTKFV